MKFAQSISIHPYFKVNQDQLETFLSKLPEFSTITAGETGCLYYNFTVNGDVVFCREAYENAEAVLEHVAKVSEPLGQALEIAELIRIEIHGPGAELEKLKEPLAHLGPEWFVFQTGVDR